MEAQQGQTSHTEERGAEMGRCCVSTIFYWTPCFTFVYFLLSSINPIFLLFSYPSPSATSQMSALTSKWQSMWNAAKRTRLQTLHLRLSVAHFQPLSSTTCLFPNPLCFAPSLIVDAADGPKHHGEQSKWVYLVMTVMMDDMSGGCLNSQEGKKTHQTPDNTSQLEHNGPGLRDQGTAGRRTHILCH